MPYDLILAKELLQLCEFAYLEDYQIKDITEYFGYSDYQYFENKNSQGYGVTKDGNVYIITRGTELQKFYTEYNDLIASFKLCKAKLVDKDVHYGYYEYFRNIRKQIAKYIKDHNDKKLFITGYSLGGTTATFLSYLYPESITYTFASPMAVSSAFDDKERHIINMYSDKDLFSQIPYGINGFKHLGERYAITKNGTIKKDGHTSNIVNRFKLTILGIVVMPLLMVKIGYFIGRYFYRHHIIKGYKERLDNAIKVNNRNR